ncbi:protein amnionless [Eupeodes corollae]|uniref:protein amnionless n=1 Tax=Eupeodes corollae TaxID=290404 RepID=UPI00248F95AA|nr:protein amnionless [Eupeodes corollae]
MMKRPFIKCQTFLMKLLKAISLLLTNKMIKHKSLFIFCLLSSFKFTSINSTKKWVENPKFEDPSSWDSGYVPCSHDEIVFPESFSSAILLPTTVDITGITLPNDGALLLQPNGEIIFDSGIDNGFECENSNQKAELKSITPRHWFDPHNWISVKNHSEGNQNNADAAVPHIEQIPCSNEVAQIAATGALSIDLSDVRTLRVGQINLDGVDVSKEFLEELFKSDLGEMIFKYASLTQVEYNKDQQCGCHNPDTFWDYEWNVCKHVHDRCERPKCNTPIIPTGHCCAICGAMIKVIVDKCDPSHTEKISQMIARSLKDQEMQDQLSYHVSYIDAGVQTYLQVIIVENDDYEEKSVSFMHRFMETVSWDEFKSSKKEFFTAGRPYDPNGLRAALLLMAGTLLGVLAFFGIIFVNFVPDNGIIRLPTWLYVRWNDVFQTPFVFARFDNTNVTDGEAIENVVIDVQQYNVSAEVQETTRGTSTSFDNPMFVDNQTKAKGKASRKQQHNDDDDDDTDDSQISEEDLTEIDLDAEVMGKL